MRVLLLSPIPHYLADALTKAGDTYVTSEARPEKWPEVDTDFIVSFGYRYIIPERFISLHRGRLINIHISLLPWNRGADPNFWSWFDRTPKGVSIHAIDAGIDTGDSLYRLPLGFENEGEETLRSSYQKLVQAAACLFEIKWKDIRQCDWSPLRPPQISGSYHKHKEFLPWFNKLPLGWDTPVKDVEELGAAVSRNN